MSKIFALTKVILKNNSNLFSSFFKKGDKNGNKKNTVINIVLLIAFVFLAISIFSVSYEILKFAKLDSNNEPIALDHTYIQNLLTLVIPYLFLSIFIFSNTLIVSIFFLSSDSHVYLAMPLKPYEIFLARFFSSLVSIYLIEFILLLPMNIAFNIITEAGFFIYLHQILIFVALPFVPICIAFLLTSLIDKIIKIQRHKEAFSIIYSLLSIIGIVGLEMIMQSIVPDGDISSNPAIIGQVKEIIANKAQAFAFFKPFNSCIMDGYFLNSLDGTLSTILFFSICALVIIFTSFLANRFYLKSIMGENEIGQKKKKEKLDLKKKRTKSIFWSYVQKEWRCLYRSPGYLVQVLFPPFIFLAICVVSISTVYFKSQAGKEEFMQTLAIVKTFLALENPLAPFIVVSLSIFLSFIMLPSASAISREGKNIYFMKMIPLSYMKQIHAKMLIGVLFSFILMALLFIGGTFILSLDWYLPLVYILPALLWILMMNYIMIYIDLTHPYLDWENEVAAVKQNRSVVITMILVFAASILFIGIGIVLYSFFPQIPGYIYLIFLTMVSIMTIALIEWKLHKNVTRIFHEMET